MPALGGHLNVEWTYRLLADAFGTFAVFVLWTIFMLTKRCVRFIKNELHIIALSTHAFDVIRSIGVPAVRSGVLPLLQPVLPIVTGLAEPLVERSTVLMLALGREDAILGVG